MLSTPLRLAAGRAIGLLVLLSGVASLAGAAPKYLGPNKCVSCHDHDKQKDWSAKDAHAKALAQLEDKNAAKYAKAIGLADPYNLKGACVACHATVFNGDANAGVSCETCHGAGSDYVEPHQQKGSYTKAVSLGMIDTRGNYAVWAKMCNDCHVLRDPKLIAAGHKSGADFEVSAGSKKIVHWAPAYDFSQLSAAGKASAGKRAAPPAPAPAKEEAKPTAVPAPPARPTPPPPRPTAVAATPAAPPARAEAPAPTATAVKKVTRPEPTAAPARVSTAAAPAAPTAAPMPPTAAARPPTPVVAAVSPAVVIEIAATPIPPITAPLPAVTVPRSPAETAMGAKPPPPATRRPAAKPKLKPRPKAKPEPQTTPVPPAPTRTATKLPAPIEPPRRPPH